VIVSRRFALISLISAAAWACKPVAQRPGNTPPDERPAEFKRWESEARSILSDGQSTLRTFETFAAFRVASAERSERRSEADLAWDPPTGVAWDEATHVARGLHGRSEQLLQSVSTALVDQSAWRLQRDLADATSGLLQLGSALNSFRDRIDRLGPGTDGTQAWDLLDRGWALWDASASRWGVSRAELIPCTAT
jgi:hypothetical protein